MATTITTNVSGISFLRLLLTDATSNTINFTNAVDGQRLTVTYQQTSTGTLIGGNVNNIVPAPSASGSDVTQSYVYDSATNSWNPAPTTPAVVAQLSSATLGFASFTTAGVALASYALPAGTYRVSIYQDITTSFSGNSVSNVGITIGYTDDDQAQTVTNNIGAVSAGSKSSTVTILRSTGAAPITLTGVAATGNPTAGNEAASVVIERLI